MNMIEKWIFNSIDLSNPPRKLSKYYGNVIFHKVKGYYLCHFITKYGYSWEEYIKPDKNGYIINKYGQRLDLNYDRTTPNIYHDVWS